MVSAPDSEVSVLAALLFYLNRYLKKKVNFFYSMFLLCSYSTLSKTNVERNWPDWILKTLKSVVFIQVSFLNNIALKKSQWF